MSGTHQMGSWSCLFLVVKNLRNPRHGPIPKMFAPPLPRSTSFPGLFPYGAAILVSNVPNLLKGGRGDGLPSPIAKYPDHHLDTFEIKMAGRLPWLSFLALEAGLFGVGGHSFGQTKSLRRMTVTGNCAWKVFGTQGTVFCAIAEK